MRIAPLLGLPRFLADHGFDSDAVIRANGCDPALFRDPENTIDFTAGGRLLAHTAAVTGCPCPGLALGRDWGLDVLGALGQAARIAPDVGTALRALIRNLHLHDRGAVPTLWEGESQAMFGYTIYLPDVPGTDHIYDMALAIARNLVAELGGPGWKATKVCLFREKPPDTSPYCRHFHSPLQFGADRAVIVFPAADLLRPIKGADASAYARALRALAHLDHASSGLASGIRRLLRRSFVTGVCREGMDLHRVARFFALHPRTLNRRLRAEGTSFALLLSQTRYEIARQMLRDTNLKTSDIAFALGYADSASFDHAFRRWSGTNATAWRRGQGLG